MNDLSIHSSNCYKKLICFSLMNVESTDDVKIVSYHWEEIKGPLREQKASADTPVLHLSNLVPGNYTFRYLHDDFLGGLSVISAKCLFLSVLTCISSNKKLNFSSAYCYSLFCTVERHMDQFYWKGLAVILHNTKLQKRRYRKLNMSPLPAITAVTDYFFSQLRSWLVPWMKLCSQAVKVVLWRMVADRIILADWSSQGIVLCWFY